MQQLQPEKFISLFGFHYFNQYLFLLLFPQKMTFLIFNMKTLTSHLHWYVSSTVYVSFQGKMICNVIYDEEKEV